MFENKNRSDNELKYRGTAGNTTSTNITRIHDKPEQNSNAHSSQPSNVLKSFHRIACNITFNAIVYENYFLKPALENLNDKTLVYQCNNSKKY